MRLTLTAALLAFSCLAMASTDKDTDNHDSGANSEPAPIALAIHGGAGTIDRDSISAEREAAIRDTLERAARAGHEVLEAGGQAIEAVTAAITILEDAPEFNAGRGAVLTSEGRVEMDASIMTGHDLAAGAVAGVQGIRHPILAARAVLEHSDHVMLSGDGAETFARSRDLEFLSDDWFITEFRRDELARLQRNERSRNDSSDSGVSDETSNQDGAGISADASISDDSIDRWFSTVGAVALDRDGNLAAGTSTGGMSNKRFGRIGDSPIIGAGTYADNRSCAVSSTGHGEYFIRHVVAYAICARMRHGGQSLAESADAMVNDVLKTAGGSGGVIALDREGNIAMPFNTPGMYRAQIGTDGELLVEIYRDR